MLSHHRTLCTNAYGTYVHLALSKSIIVLKINFVKRICETESFVHFIAILVLRTLKNCLHVILCTACADSCRPNFLSALSRIKNLSIVRLVDKKLFGISTIDWIEKLHLGWLIRLDKCDIVTIIIVANLQGMRDIDLGVSISCSSNSIDYEGAAVALSVDEIINFTLCLDLIRKTEIRSFVRCILLL